MLRNSSEQDEDTK